MRKGASQRMTKKRSPDWDPDEQEAFDKYVPEFIESVRIGYLDDHLRDIVRAMYERRGVLEGKTYVVEPTNAPQPKKRMLPAMARKKRESEKMVPIEDIAEDLSEVKSMVFAEPSDLTPKKADNPSGLHPNAYGMVTDPVHNMSVYVGKLPRKRRYFSGSFKWELSEDEVYYFTKTKLPGLNIYITPHIGIESAVHGEIFKVTKVNNTTVEGILKTLTSPHYNLRSNSPWLKSFEEDRVVKIPIQCIKNNLALP